MAQSGARLVDVGTTNRTRLADYSRALARTTPTSRVLKVHPSNYRVDGFVESTSVAELATLGVAGRRRHRQRAARRRPARGCRGPPPAWLHGEPAARQTLARRRRAGHVQRRQAARRPAGRDHRRPGRPRRRVRAPPAGPGAAAGRARARRAAATRPRLPRRDGGNRRSRSGGWPPRRSTTCSARAGKIVAAAGVGDGRADAKRCPGAGSAPGHDDPVGRHPHRRRPSGRAAVRRPADHRPRSRRRAPGSTCARSIPADDDARRRGALRRSRVRVSPPPATSTTASRRSCWRSPAPTPTGSRRRSAAG